MGQTPAKPVKPWANQPFKIVESPSHRLGLQYKPASARAFADEMAIVHSHIVRMLNSIYLQAPNVSEPQDVADFLTFIHAWLMLLHEHHGNEETHFFPWIEEYIGIPGLLAPNVEQHHAFEPGSQELDKYVIAVREGKEKYDGMKLRGIIDRFGEVLSTHLIDEVNFLLGLEKYDDKVDWVALGKRIQKHAVSTADTEYVIPIMVMNADNTYEKGQHESYWPPFPWFAGYIFRWVYVPKHKGAWRFGCSDSYGNPRDLPFVEPVKL